MAKAKSVQGLSAQAPTGENARKIARTRLEELYTWNEYVGQPYAVHELHNLRIAAKRLRYTLEIFEPALPLASQPAIREVEQIQEELGSLHDSDVLIALLRLCLGSWDAGESYVSLMAHSRKLTQGRIMLDPALLRYLLDEKEVPSKEVRAGLEMFLRDLQQGREAQYRAFQQHWQQLKAHNFFAEVLAILAD